MNQEDKDLLLQDLCARLPYKPKIKVLSLWNENKEVEEDIVDSVYCVMPDGYINTETIDSDISLYDIVLYLRPMSSMTEEEKKELINISPYFVNGNNIVIGVQCNSFAQISKCQEWLNKKMFDYHGLIEKGIALEAPEGMYNIKEK